MAYDGRIRSLIYATVAVALGAISWLVSPLTTFAREVVAWPDFVPTASESIALDVATRTEVDDRQPGIWSWFKAFVERALAHADYSAGHFDPGRMPA